MISKETGNQYKIMEKIGSGAYAEVFKGQNINTKEIVAIKKMKHMKKAVTLPLLRMPKWPKNKLNS